MRNRHVMLYDFHYLGIYVHIAYNSHFGVSESEAMVVSEAMVA